MEAIIERLVSEKTFKVPTNLLILHIVDIHMMLFNVMSHKLCSVPVQVLCADETPTLPSSVFRL